MRKHDARGDKAKAKPGRPTIGSSHAVTGRKGPAPKPRPKGKAGAKPPMRPHAPAKSSQKPRRAATHGPRRILDPSARPSEEAKALAVAIATAALDKKAVNVQIVDVVGRVDYADFLVLMSGRSDRHTVSIADGIEEHLVRQTPKRKPAVEGREQGNWIVLDFGDVVAHVFQEEARAFYDLDALWQDARRVPVATA